jgi:hypothetical protein
MIDHVRVCKSRDRMHSGAGGQLSLRCQGCASYVYSASIASCVCEHVKDGMHCLSAILLPLFNGVACLLAMPMCVST